MSHDLAAHARGVCGPPFCTARQPRPDNIRDIRLGLVDPYVENADRLDASHARRTAAILHDERHTLDAEDGRLDDLGDRAQAWEERANALEAAGALDHFAAGKVPSVDACIRHAYDDGLAAPGVDRYLATDARAELDVLRSPTLTARWVTRSLRTGDGITTVYVYVLTYRLAGHEWTGEAAVPPGIDAKDLDPVSLRRVQQGAAKALREQIIPTGTALEAAIQTGGPRR